jgi:hypothetical protein
MCVLGVFSIRKAQAMIMAKDDWPSQSNVLPHETEPFPFIFAMQLRLEEEDQEGKEDPTRPGSRTGSAGVGGMETGGRSRHGHRDGVGQEKEGKQTKQGSWQFVSCSWLLAIVRALRPLHGRCN